MHHGAALSQSSLGTHFCQLKPWEKSILPSWWQKHSSRAWRVCSTPLQYRYGWPLFLPTPPVLPSQQTNQPLLPYFCIFFLHSLSLCYVLVAPVVKAVPQGTLSGAHFFPRARIFAGWQTNTEVREGFSLFLFGHLSNKSMHVLSEPGPLTMATNAVFWELERLEGKTGYQEISLGMATSSLYLMTPWNPMA